MKRVAVILSGSGVFDGTEIHEAVISLLAIREHGATYECFAPDMTQLHVINHLSGEVMEEESRNVLVESARIARGSVRPVSECNVDEFDALVLPGGFGAAKNLCTFAVDGPECEINEDVLSVCKAFASAKKPAGYACIAPVLAAAVYGSGHKVTIGNDKDTAGGVEVLGGSHVNCPVTEIIVDADAKLVTTPAYMLANDILEAKTGIDKMIATVLTMA